MNRILEALLAVLLAATLPAATVGEWRALDPADPPADNPLRGLMPYQGSGGFEGFPHSLEYQYVAMRDLVPAASTFNFTAIESLLDDVAARGKQTVFRIYLDYPNCCPDGTYQSGVPDFLLTGPDPVTFFDYPDHGGGSSPDYDNERLLGAVEELAAALGTAYDGDPRLGFLQVGVVGMWGEWHTYPYDGSSGNPNLMPQLAGQARVLRAFGNAFSVTPLVISQDSLDQWDDQTPCGPGTLCTDDFESLGVGFHDDNFCVGTYDATGNLDWYFWPKLQDRNLGELWRGQPIGGEIQPTIQDTLFTAGWSGQDYEAAVLAVHASFLLDQFAFEADADADRVARTLDGAAVLGYRLQVTEADVGDLAQGASLDVGVRLVNSGAAPFYYAWPVELAVRANGFVVASWTPDWDLRQVVPGEPAVEWWLHAGDPQLADGEYEIALRVPNPMVGGLPLGFANADSDGEWLTLGHLDLIAGLIFMDGFESASTAAWN